MKKSSAFLLALLITLAVALNVYLFNSSAPEQRTKVIITETIDGDTLASENERFRLANINTPEKSEQGYEEAKDFLAQLNNQTVEVEILGADRYGRTLVRIYAPDYINLKIVEQGLGKKFLVEESEAKEFAEAERAAVENNRGMWKRSQYFGCFEIFLEQSPEYLHIKNNCPQINLWDWVVTDESRKRYKFPSIVVGEVNLHTGNGKNNSTDVFWNQAQNVWNNDRDTVYLFDSNGKIALHHDYNY